MIDLVARGLVIMDVLFKKVSHKKPNIQNEFYADVNSFLILNENIVNMKIIVIINLY